MQIVDVTKEPTVPFLFAQTRWTTTDTTITKRVCKKIVEYLAEFSGVETPPSSVTFFKKNKRNLRIVIYDFKKLLITKNIFVVAFYGNKRRNLSEEFTKEFFTTDWEIAMSMNGNATILTYASQELSDGNWFNIVLFTNEEAKENVTAKDRHNYAAYTLAPKRFTWVRLHNGFLPNGIQKSSDLFFTNTKYYNFDTIWFATRNY